MPCEWLRKITPRPLLNFLRYVRHASRTSAYACASISGVTVCELKSPWIVTCRYTGA